MAPPLVPVTRAGLAGGCETLGSPTGVHPGPGRAGEGTGLPTTRSQRAAAVTLDLPRTGQPRGQHRTLPVDLSIDSRAVAARGRVETVAIPVVDLHLRPGLREQSPERARPLRPPMGRETLDRQRLRHLRR